MKSLPFNAFATFLPYLARHLTDNYEAHSETHLTESREYWWNKDYLQLLAERLHLEECLHLADIGCGHGLMAFLLAPFIPSSATIEGIDTETKYVKKAIQKAKKFNKDSAITFHFQQGDVMNLPFESKSMDLVLCQTLLMHVEEPLAAIAEMKRCTKSGGYVVAFEPNNLASSLMFDHYSQTDYEIEEMLSNIEVRLRCEKGKKRLGEGFSSIGDSLPDLFQQAGLEQIQMFISDKSLNLIPPYDTKEKRLRAAQMIDWIENQTGGFGYAENWRYYKAGGGTKMLFDVYWERVNRYQQQLLENLKKQNCFLSGGNLMYVVIGQVV